MLDFPVWHQVLCHVPHKNLIFALKGLFNAFLADFSMSYRKNQHGDPHFFILFLWNIGDDDLSTFQK